MTSTIRSIVYSAASQSIPLPFASSALIWNCVSFAHTIHRSYHFLSRLDRYSRIENAPPLLIGVALELALGDKKIVNFVAKTLDASLHTLKGVNAYMRLSSNIDKLHKLLSFKEGSFKKYDFKPASKPAFLSSSTLLRLSELKNKYRYMFFHLIDTIIAIAADFFLLSSHMVAACEAMQGHELQVIEGPLNVKDIFSEAYKINKGAFVEVNDRILKGLGAKFDTRSLYSHFQKEKEDKGFELEFPNPDLEKTFDKVKKWGQHLMSKLSRLDGIRRAVPDAMITLSPFERPAEPFNFRTVIIYKNLK